MLCAYVITDHFNLSLNIVHACVVSDIVPFQTLNSGCQSIITDLDCHRFVINLDSSYSTPDTFLLAKSSCTL